MDNELLLFDRLEVIKTTIQTYRRLGYRLKKDEQLKLF